MTDYLCAHFETSALLLVDVQYDFLEGGASPVPGTLELIPALARLAGAYRRAGLPIAHTVRFFRAGGRDADLVLRDRIESGERIVAPNSLGADIPRAVLPRPVALDTETLHSGDLQEIGDHEVVMYKSRWSAFYRTRLEEWLRDSGVDTVVVCGTGLPACSMATLVDAADRDFRTVLVRDAVPGATGGTLADLHDLGVQIHEAGSVLEATGRVPARFRPRLILGQGRRFQHSSADI